MVKESSVITAINHILNTMDQKGYDKITDQSRKAYDVLYALREGLEGSIDDGSAIVFYNP